MVKLRSEAVWLDTAAAWRAWLATNHATSSEIWLGLSKSHVAGGISYPDAIDEALCFGWIDGITHTVDADGFTVRFTPRTTKSGWSAINIRRISELIAEGRVHPAGLAAFERRTPPPYPVDKDGDPLLSDNLNARFVVHQKSWQWFCSAAPGYRRQAIVWVMSAKRAETRDRRLASLIEASSRAAKVRELS